MRKAIERVFGILEKRFRILKIPLPCYDIMQVVDIMHSCFILHDMILEDKDRLNLGTSLTTGVTRNRMRRRSDVRCTTEPTVARSC